MVLNSIKNYGKEFQIKVIASLLTDKSFLQNIFEVLNEEDFESQSSQWIISQIRNYFLKYHHTIDSDTLKIELKKLENDVLKTAVKETLKSATQYLDDNLEYVKNEFTTFLRNQSLKKALLDSVEMLNIGDYDSIRNLVDHALKAGLDKNIGHEYNKDVEYRYRENNRNPIEFPWAELNEITQEGFGSGDLFVGFGGPGSGKSWFLAALGAHACKLGKNVLHYTLELSEDYVGRRYDSIYTGIDIKELHLHKNKVENVISDIPGKLIIKEYGMGRASLRTIENHIQQCINNDFKPDLIIIDYLDLLKPNRLSKEKREEIDDIYVAAKGLARHIGLPMLSVSQVNRMGAKDVVIEGDKAAGSYGKMAVIDFGFSISRTRKDKVNKTGRVHIMKNRYGEDGMTYNASINTSNGEINILDLFDDENDMEDETKYKPAKEKIYMNKEELLNKYFELEGQNE